MLNRWGVQAMPHLKAGEKMRIVNLYKEKYNVFIGRGSIFGNPFKIQVVGSRKKSISLYENYVRKQIAGVISGDNSIKLPKAIYDLPEDAILGCYCKPKACHGDIIIKIWKELHESIST